MSAKSSIKYASIDAEHPKETFKVKKSSRKNADSKSAAKNSHRSQSLDRTIDDSSGDSREERRNRRQFMHLVSSVLTFFPEYYM